MNDSKIVTIIQTYKIFRNVTVEHSWYDLEERTIEREIDTEGRVLSEEEVDRRIVDENCEPEEEEVGRDENLPDDELVEETFAEEE
jgi:hypothetical protein